MAIQQYALVSEDLTHVLNPNVMIDSGQVAAWIAAGNPKGGRYLRVVITEQPTTDPATGQPVNPATQTVMQTGWTVNSAAQPPDVEPVWRVVNLTAAQQTAVSNQQFANAQLVTADLLTFINALSTSTFASLTATQQTTIIKRLLEAEVALIRSTGRT